MDQAQWITPPHFVFLWICRSVIEKVEFTDEREITSYSYPGFEVRR